MVPETVVFHKSKPIAMYYMTESGVLKTSRNPEILKITRILRAMQRLVRRRRAAMARTKASALNSGALTIDGDLLAQSMNLTLDGGAPTSADRDIVEDTITVAVSGMQTQTANKFLAERADNRPGFDGRKATQYCDNMFMLYYNNNPVPNALSEGDVQNKIDHATRLPTWHDVKYAFFSF